MEYITTKEAAAKWGISAIRVTVLANEGRIPGAQHLGRNWLIPANATKPPSRNPHARQVKEEVDAFSFPLFHFRPDWNHVNKNQLSTQQQVLLQAETAVMGCRFADALQLIEPVLGKPDDMTIEIGSLWVSGICCIALNKTEDFSRSFLRMQVLLAGELPHNDDLRIIFDYLNTYIETMSSSAKKDTYNADIHDHCIPLTCMLIGYTQLAKEIMTHKSADTAIMELGLRLLNSTGAAVVIEMIHIYLMGIYSLRQNNAAAEKHAELAVQIAYESKIYFPLVTYFSYNTLALSPVIDRYPEEFRKQINTLALEYDKNFADFLIFISEYSVISRLKDTDSPYICAVVKGLSNTAIAKKLGVSQQTVKRKIEKICEVFGVTNKKELRDYLNEHI